MRIAFIFDALLYGGIERVGISYLKFLVEDGHQVDVFVLNPTDVEDIIEEIVGDIQDEFDNEREDITSLGNNTYLCDARVNLRDLNDTIDASFPADDFDSLGGFVFDLFGKVPVKFEKASWNDFDFIVQDIEGHRINSVKVIKKSNDDGSSNDKKE